jgi:DNA-binding transcriptional LysR family regulator
MERTGLASEVGIELPLTGKGEVGFTLKELRHVMLLVQTRNFIRAAKLAGVTQSAISQSIASLEARLGLILFDRSRRHVEPSAIAALIAERARVVLNTVDEMSAQVEALRDARIGSLNFGLGLIPASRLIHDAMARFNLVSPGVHLRVDVDYPQELVNKLQHGQLEFCVAVQLPEDDSPGITCEPLYEEPFGFLSRPGHPLVGKPHLSARDVVRYPLIAYSERNARQQFSSHLKTAEEFSLLEQNVPTVTMQRPELLVPFLESTDHLMLVATHPFREMLESGRLVQLPIADLFSDTQVCLMTRNGLALSPAAMRMTEIFRDLARAIRHGGSTAANGTASTGV